MSERHQRLAAALPQPALPRVADLGCGGGLTLAALRERLGPEVELIGVERREPELERISFGPLGLKGLEPGAYRRLTAAEIDRLRAAGKARRRGR